MSPDGYLRPELGFVKRAIAIIRTWLRANMPGFADMKVTDAEIIQQFILPARRFVERGQQAAAARGALAFARKSAILNPNDFAIAALVKKARQPGNDSTVLEVAGVAPAQAATLQRAGIDIDTTSVHTIDVSGLRHAMNRHADPKTEISRNQLPLTDADFLRISEVVSAPDAYVVGPKSKRGLDLVAYIKRFDDGSTLYIEEVRTGKNRMAMLSMRKYPGTKDFNSIAQTLLSNAQSDAGEVRIVLPSTVAVIELLHGSACCRRCKTAPSGSKSSRRRQGRGSMHMTALVGASTSSRAPKVRGPLPPARLLTEHLRSNQSLTGNGRASRHNQLMKHLVLLGDSIFDNRAYVGGGLAVIDQVKRRVPQGWQASLLAVDGNTSKHIAEQLKRMPQDATHIVLSVGGNDALGCLPQLGAPAANVIGALGSLAELLAPFRRSYMALMADLLALNKPLMVCTVYDDVPGLTDALKAALGLFNDVILREAIRCGVPVLDLRMICTEPGDYSEKSPIEPSSKGGAKLADRLVTAVLEHDFKHRGCAVYS